MLDEYDNNLSFIKLRLEVSSRRTGCSVSNKFFFIVDVNFLLSSFRYECVYKIQHKKIEVKSPKH